MNIEAMAGYPVNMRINRSPIDANLLQIQGQISVLTENIQELTIQRSGHAQVWCIGFYTKGHLENECPRMRGVTPLQNPMGPSGPMCYHCKIFHIGSQPQDLAGG
jgi:hypothetical protein